MKNYNPKTIEALKHDLACLGPQSKIISGGTDLIIRLHQGLEPDALLYIGNVEGIDRIEETSEYLYVGAGCTMQALAESELVKRHAKALSDAASDVGSPQIRHHGTVGGNIANASPAGDTLPVMFLLDAMVVIVSPEGINEKPIQEVILGPGKTCLTSQQAIIGFKIAKRDAKTRSAFVKLGFRGKVTISRIGMAVELTMENGVVQKACVMAGAISLTPVRVNEAEAALIGKKLDENVIKQAGQAVSDLIMQITPEKFDRDYKVYAAKGVVEDVLKRFIQ